VVGDGAQVRAQVCSLAISSCCRPPRRETDWRATPMKAMVTSTR
jgi:hypothetical protein